MRIRCRPARGLVLIYREFSLDIENIFKGSRNLTLAAISFVEKYCDANYLLLYSLTPSTRSRFEL
jgi:hypothetical protein